MSTWPKKDEMMTSSLLSKKQRRWPVNKEYQKEVCGKISSSAEARTMLTHVWQPNQSGKYYLRGRISMGYIVIQYMSPSESESTCDLLSLKVHVTFWVWKYMSPSESESKCHLLSLSTWLNKSLWWLEQHQHSAMCSISTAPCAASAQRHVQQHHSTIGRARVRLCRRGFKLWFLLLK